VDNVRSPMSLEIAEFDQARDLETFIRIYNQIYPHMQISAQGWIAAASHRSGFWRMVVARQDGVGVGFARAMTDSYDPSTVEVSLGVESASRQNGVGTALANAIGRAVAERPERYVRVFLREGNEVGKAMAESYGLRLYATWFRFEGETQDLDLTASTPPNYRVEPIKDWGAAHEVFRLTLRDDPDDLVAPDYKTFRELTVDDPGFVERSNLGAYYKGKLVGVTLLRARNGQGEVFYTGVVPRHRAKGLATVLKARSIFEARRQGITNAYTDVHSGNTPMIRVNEKLGMKRAVGLGQWVMRTEIAGLNDVRKAPTQ
jgi:GNAT superfamily N-acetyltransferase